MRLVLNGVSVGTFHGNFSFVPEPHGLAVTRVSQIGGSLLIETQAPAVVAPHHLNLNEMALTQQGRIIEAVKAVRHRTGLLLKEAKELVDHYRAKCQPGPTARTPWNEPGGAA